MTDESVYVKIPPRDIPSHRYNISNPSVNLPMIRSPQSSCQGVLKLHRSMWKTEES